MNIVRNAVCGSLALALGMGAFAAQAQEASAEQTTKPRAVLFKVHDIKPVENTEGVVTHCDFLVTFYNRTPDSMRQAKINMGWTDEVSERYVIDSDEVKTKPVSRNSVRGQQNNAKNLGPITTSVDMPALGSYKQATVKGSVKTEKCFLLLDNLDFEVASCSIIGRDNNDAVSDRRRRIAATRSTSECAGLFEYVDSKNPEYYDEFKNISYSEQERLLKDEKKQDTSDIEASYEEIVKNFDKANSIVNNIK